MLLFTSQCKVKQVEAGAVNAQSCDMDKKRSAQQAYVRKAMEATGLDATNLARRAGLSSPTLTRFLNAPDGKFLLSVRTLSAIATVSGLPISAEATGFVSVAPEDIGERLNEAELSAITAEAVDLLKRLPRSDQVRYLEYLRGDVKRLKDD